jgi:hypothetical protein
MDKASERVGKRKKNPKPFIASARIRTYNKLMGIKDSTAGFRSVSRPTPKMDTKDKVFGGTK